MGYRSNVAVNLTIKSHELFEKCLKELNTGHKEIIKDSEIFENNGVDNIKLSWENIKWYVWQFEEIQNFMSWLIEKSEQGVSYHFVRIGEDLQDIEEEIVGEPEYWVYVTRTLDFD